MKQELKFETVKPSYYDTYGSPHYNLYDYEKDTYIDCIDYNPFLPIYYVEHPTTKKPLFFKLIPGFDDCYGVTKEGKVISFKSRFINTATEENYPLKVKILKNGLVGNKIMYKCVNLSHNGHCTLQYVHHLVLECWVGTPTSCNPDFSEMLTPPECNHKDNNPYNNDYTNLEWCDRFYNNSHRVPSEEWGFEHTPDFYEKQLNKFKLQLENLQEENILIKNNSFRNTTDKKYSDLQLENRYNFNCRKIESLKYEINMLEEYFDE